MRAHAHAIARSEAYREPHPIPSPVRKAVLKRAKGRCGDCGESEPLEMHHATYNLYEVTHYHRDVDCPIFGDEPPRPLPLVPARR